MYLAFTELCIITGNRLTTVFTVPLNCRFIDVLNIKYTVAVLILILLWCTVLHTETYQKEWGYIFNPICKPLRVPNATVIQ